MALLTFGWHDVVFEHYRVVDEAPIRRRLPAGVELDRHRGAAYVSVVSVRVLDNRLAGRLPLFGSRDYVQINLRTYVRRGETRGLAFLHNLVSNPLGSTFGKLAYAVPNHVARAVFSDEGGTLAYQAQAPGERIHLVSGRVGRALRTAPGSLSEFLVERYVQYAGIGAPRWRLTVQSEVSHRPWPLRVLDVAARSHGFVHALDLTGALEPVEEVHTSAGVDAELGYPQPLVAVAQQATETGAPRHA